MNFAVLLAIIAPVLSLSSGIPAVVRPFRARSTDGLSEPAIVAGIACTMMWGIYGFLVSDPSQLATNVPMFVMRVALVAFVFAACKQRQRFARMCAIALCGVVGAGLAGAVVIGLVAATLGLVQQLPQLAHTLRHGRGPALSVGSLSLGAVSSTVWAAYGASRGDMIVFSCSAIVTGVTLTLLAAALTPAGHLLHVSRQAAVTVAHADMVALRRCTRVAPATARAAAEFVPKFAQVARDRERAFGERAQRARAQRRYPTTTDHG